MDVCHENKTDDDDDNTSQLDAVVRVDAVSKVVGDGFVVVGNQNTSNDKSEAANKPT